MGMNDNPCIPFYEPGKSITCQASATVTGKRFVAISGNRQSGPALSTATDGGNYLVAPAGAGVRAFGVSGHDAASGEKVKVRRGSGWVLPVTAGGTITAGAEVECDSVGRAIALASGKALGIATTGATSGNDAEIALY
jgi:predicted RecA/RadA family phage recombinase